MLIQETVDEFYVHTKRFRLSVAYVEKTRKSNVHGAKLKIMLDSKENNLLPLKLTAEIQMEEMPLKTLYRKLASSRLYIHRCFPRLTLLQELSIILKDTTSSFTQKQISTVDMAVNYGMKYWREEGMEGCTSWPVELSFLKKNQEGATTIGQINIYLLQLGGKKIMQLEGEAKLGQIKKEEKEKKRDQMKQKICSEFTNIANSKSFTISQQMSILQSSSKLFPLIPLDSLTIKKSQQKYSQRQQLFRHIFLTEVLTHMIINQFSRSKQKKNKYRDGRIIYCYEDKQLEALRSCGLRFSEFKDYSAETYHPPEQEIYSQNSSDDEEIKGSDDEYNHQVKKKKKKTEVQRVGKKIKRFLKNRASKNREAIENFLVISGEDKSQINKKRYCLHQMTRETDKTQALINFIQLVFSAHWPKDQLFLKDRDSEIKKKARMTYFMKNFKVKRYSTSCLEQYTRQSFFHKILNIGLRTLKNPHELTYLRLPFSHIFWSIKTIYQRHKKAIFQQKKQKNVGRKRIIKLYRGCSMSEEQINTLLKSVGLFIEMQGFLSTTLAESIANNFQINVIMVIEIPVMNLSGMYDNGFANISSFSEHPNEREILLNAFNLFKIQNGSLTMKNQLAVYTFRLQYGGIKEVEEKVGKSENLLESEFLMKMEEEKISSVRHLLSMKEEKLTPKLVEQLKESLAPQEKELEKWKETLRKQEKQEFAAAYKELSQWEQELLDNYTHQEQEIKNIDSYGQLLVALGDYERGAAYCKRMLKQVERDRAIEGWQWRKTPCLPHKQQVYRLLLAECHSRDCRHQQQVIELQKVKQIYTDLKKPTHDRTYLQLLTQLIDAHEPLLYLRDRRQESQYVLEREKICSEHNIEEANMSHYTLFENEVPMSHVSELQGKIRQQRQKLKQMSIHTRGQHTAHYLSQHCALIFMLNLQQQQQYPSEKQKRNYNSVIQESITYLESRKLSSDHRYTTISLFQTILAIFEEQSKVGRKWICTIGNFLTQFLTESIYHEKQIYLVERCVKLCWFYGERMSGKRLLVKCARSKIQYPFSSALYYHMVIIYAWMWSIGKECREWVKSIEYEIYSYHQLENKLEGRPLTSFMKFPFCIDEWDDDKEFHTWEVDGVDWAWGKEVQKRCQQIQILSEFEYNLHIDRRLDQLSHSLQKCLLIHHLKQQRIDPQHELRKILGENKSEVRVLWKQPCEVADRGYSEYSIAKYMAKGDVMMVLKYLKYPYQNCFRAFFSTSRLHLPRESSYQLESLIPIYQYIDRQKKNILTKIQKRHDCVATQLEKQYLRRTQIEISIPCGKKRQQKTTLFQSRRPHHQQLQTLLKCSQEWGKFQSQARQSLQLLQLEQSIRDRKSLCKTKEYYKLAIRDKRNMKRVRTLDKYQRGMVDKLFPTLSKLHLQRVSLRPQEAVEGEGSSLTALVGEKIYQEIEEGGYLQTEQYLIPTFKALLSQRSLPFELLECIFYHYEKCEQVLHRLLESKKWSSQLEYHYPRLYQDVAASSSISSKVSALISNLISSGEQKVEGQQEILHMRHAVLGILIHAQQLHPTLIDLLTPITHYSSIQPSLPPQQEHDQIQWYFQDDEEDEGSWEGFAGKAFQQEQEEYHQMMKGGFQALVKVCVESKSFLSDGSWMPRWWSIQY